MYSRIKADLCLTKFKCHAKRAAADKFFFAKICNQRKHHNVPVFIIMLDTSIHSLSSDFFYLFYILTSNNLLHIAC